MKRSLMLFLLLSNVSWAQLIQVKKSKSNVEISVSSISLKSKSFEKELKSGLTTKVDVVLELKNKTKRITLSKIEYESKYDLWDEIFYFRKNKKKTSVKKTMNSVLKAFSEIQFDIPKKLIINSGLSDPVYFSVNYIINPIKKEKTKKIKKWIAERNVSKTNIGGRVDNTSNILTGIVNQVVISELDKNYYGASEAISFKSKTYKMKEILNDK